MRFLVLFSPVYSGYGVYVSNQSSSNCVAQASLHGANHCIKQILNRMLQPTLVYAINLDGTRVRELWSDRIS